jgi:hypothetical protein
MLNESQLLKKVEEELKLLSNDSNNIEGHLIQNVEALSGIRSSWCSIADYDHERTLDNFHGMIEQLTLLERSISLNDASAETAVYQLEQWL